MNHIDRLTAILLLLQGGKRNAGATLHLESIWSRYVSLSAISRAQGQV